MSYYLMHRGWLDHEMFGEDEPFCRRAAWAWLIENAAFDRTRVRIAGKTVELARGQLSYSLRFLAKTWSWGHERVRRFLAELRQRDMIETEGETGQTVITIRNYTIYQAHEKSARQPKRRTRDRSETNKKEGNEESLSVDPDGSTGADAEAPAPSRAAVAVKSSPMKELWDKAVCVLGPGSRGLIGSARKKHGDYAVMEALLATEGECASEPIPYFMGCLRNVQPSSEGFDYRKSPGATIYAAANNLLRDIEAGRYSCPGIPPDGPLLAGDRARAGAPRAA